MIGLPTLGLVLVIALVVFGPKKLPEVGKALGKSIHDFKEEAEDKPEPMKNVTQKPAELEAETGKKDETIKK